MAEMIWNEKEEKKTNAFNYEEHNDNIFGGNVQEVDDPEEAKKVNETEVAEAEVKSDEDFMEMAMAIYKEAFGEDFDEAKAKEAAEGMLKKADGDYGAAVGMLQSSLG